MAQTIGSFDLASLKNLRDDVTQYFWFESNSSSAWGSGAHVTLYPESQFTDSTSPNYMKGQNIIMNTDGFSIRNGALPMMVLDNNSLDFNAVDTTNNRYTTVATFGSTGATIGQIGETRVEIDFRSMQLIDKDDDTYFHLGDLLTADGLIEYETIANGVDDMYRLPTYVQTPLDLSKTLVTVDGVPQTWGIGSARPYIFIDLEDTTWIEFPGNTPPQNSVIFIQYEPSQYVETKYLTYGSRADTQACGGFSSVFGEDCSAIGANSFAQGKGTKAVYTNAVAIGQYNYIDTNITQMFTIGNGTADNARSNALTVDWSGRVQCGDQAGNFKSIFDIFYPKGSYYETSLTNAIPSGGSTPTATDLENLGVTWFDPNYAWGGTWVLETAGQFHISAGTGYGIGTTGGSANAVVVEHNHTQNAHHHIAFKYKTAQIPTGSSGAIRVWDYSHSGDSTANTNDVTATNIKTGVDGTGKNLPPYVAVNRWHRTA